MFCIPSLGFSMRYLRLAYVLCTACLILLFYPSGRAYSFEIDILSPTSLHYTFQQEGRASELHVQLLNDLNQGIGHERIMLMYAPLEETSETVVRQVETDERGHIRVPVDWGEGEYAIHLGYDGSQLYASSALDFQIEVKQRDAQLSWSAGSVLWLRPGMTCEILVSAKKGVVAPLLSVTVPGQSPFIRRVDLVGRENTRVLERISFLAPMGGGGLYFVQAVLLNTEVFLPQTLEVPVIVYDRVVLDSVEISDHILRGRLGVDGGLSEASEIPVSIEFHSEDKPKNSRIYEIPVDFSKREGFVPIELSLRGLPFGDYRVSVMGSKGGALEPLTEPVRVSYRFEGFPPLVWVVAGIFFFGFSGVVCWKMGRFCSVLVASQARFQGGNTAQSH